MLQVQSTNWLVGVVSEVFVVVRAKCYAGDCTSIRLDSGAELHMYCLLKPSQHNNVHVIAGPMPVQG